MNLKKYIIQIENKGYDNYPVQKNNTTYFLLLTCFLIAITVFKINKKYLL